MGRLRAFVGSTDGRWLLLILAMATALRLALLPATAYLTEVFTDEYTFKRHVVFIHERGLLDSFRDTGTSYVAYQYLMWALALPYGWFGGAFDTDAFGLKALVKAPPLLYDLALIAVVYAVARALLPRDRASFGALGVSALVALHPVVVYDSAVWAQIDAVVAVSGLAAMAFAAAGRPELACAALAFGVLHKPQPVIFTPVVGVLVVRASGVRGLVRGGFAAAAVLLVPLVPWLVAGDAERLVDTYRKLFNNNNGVTALTQNAWNLWWFIPFDKVPESTDVLFAGVTYQRFSLGCSLVAAALATAYAWRFPTLRAGLVAAGYLFVAFYVLPTNTHERYMYPAIALLAPALLVERRLLWVYAALSATLFVNMVLVAPPVESWMRRWDDAVGTHYVAGLNVVVFAAFSWMLLSDLLWPAESSSPEVAGAARAEAEAA